MIERHATALEAFFTTRLGLLLVVWVSMLTLPVSPRTAAWPEYPNNHLLAGWVVYDGGWYRDIAEHGYTNAPRAPGGWRDTAFFPLYPLLIAAGRALGGGTLWAGVLISLASFLAALVLLQRVLEESLGRDVARRAIILLAAFPYSFFFGAVYGESLFLLCTVAAFYFGQREKWTAAGICAAAAGATRVVGAVMPFALLVMYLERRRVLRGNAAGILIGFAGPLAHLAYLRVRFGNALLFIDSQKALGWSRDPIDGSNLRSVAAMLRGQIMIMPLLNLITIVVAIAMLAWARKRQPKSFTVWGGLTLLLSLGAWKSGGRLTAPVFPVFSALAILFASENVPYRAWLFTSILLLGTFAAIFSHFYWVA